MAVTRGVTFVGATVGTPGANLTSGSWTLPSGWLPGDFAIFVYNRRESGATFTEPGTVTQQLDFSSAGSGQMFIGYRTLVAGDTTFAWTAGSSSNNTNGFYCLVFRNVNGSAASPFERTSAANPATFANTLTPDPPALSAATILDKDVVVTFYGRNDDWTTVTAPSTYSTDASAQWTSTAGTDGAAAAAWLLDVAAGTTSNPGTWSMTGGAATGDGLLWTAALRSNVRDTFTANAVIRSTISGSFTANAVIRKTISSSFTADAVIKKTISSSFTADAVIIAGAAVVEGSFTTNAVVQRTQVTSTQSQLLATSTANFGRLTATARQAQSFVPAASGPLVEVRWRPNKSGGPSDFAILELQSDASGSPSETVLATLETVIGTTVNGSLRTVALSGPVLTSGTTYWLVMRRSGALSDIHYYTTATASGDVYAGTTKSYVGSWSSATNDLMFVATVGTSFLTIDAVVKREQASSFTADAVTKREQTGSFTLNAVIKKTIFPPPGYEEGFNFYAAIKREQAGSLSSNAVIKTTITGSLTANAVTKKTQTGSFTLNAVIKRTIVVPRAWRDSFERTVGVGLGSPDAPIEGVYQSLNDPELGSVGGGVGHPRGSYQGNILFADGLVDVQVDFRTSVLEGVAVETGRWQLAANGEEGWAVWASGITSYALVGFNPGADEWWRARATYDGTIFQTKVWKVGDPEPDWLASQAGSLHSQQVFYLSSNATPGEVDNLIVATGPLTADAVILRTQTGLFTLDAVIDAGLQTIEGSLTADAVILRTQPCVGDDFQSGAFQGDAFETCDAGSLTLDAYIASGLQTVEGSFTANAVTRREQTGGFTANAVIKREQTGSLTADAVIFRTQTGSFSINAVVVRTQTGSFTADAVVKATVEGSFTANAVIGRTIAGSFTANAVVKREIAGSLTANAVIFRTQAGTFTANAVVKREITGSFTANAAIRRETTGSLTANAVIQKTTAGSFTINAAISVLVWDDTFTRTTSLGLGSVNGHPYWYFDDGRIQFAYVNGSEARMPESEFETAINTFGGIVGVRSGTAQFDFFVPSDPNEGNTDYWLHLDDTFNTPTLKVNYNSTNTWEVRFFGTSPSTHTFGVEPSTWYTVKANFSLTPGGTPVYLKVWKRSDPEPAWQFARTTTAFGSVRAGGAVNFQAPYIPPFTEEGRLDNLHIWSSETSFYWTEALTLDAVLLAEQSGSFTIDAFVEGVTTSAFSVDAVIFATQAGSFTADAVIQREATGSLTLDALLLRVQVGSFTIDAYLAPGTIENGFTLDATLRRERTGGVTADAVILRAQSGSLTADAVVLRTITGSSTVDAVLLREATDSFTANAVIQTTSTGSFTADAVVSRTQSATFSLDAVLTRAGAGTFTLDALLRIERSGSFTADATILRTQAGALTADAVLFATRAGTVTVDAFIAGQLTVNAVLLRTQTGSVTFDAFIGGHLTTDAVVLRTQTGALTIGAFVQGVNTYAFAADAVVRREATGSLTTDAITQATTQGQLTVDATLIRTQAGSITLGALILRAVTGTFTVDAVTKATATGSFTLDARLSQTVAGSVALDAVLLKSITGNFNAQAVLFSTRSATFSLDAIRRVTATGSWTLDAVIVKTTAASITANAVILATRTVGITANAVILSPRTGAFTLDAYFAQPIGGSFTVDAVVSAPGAVGALTVNAVIRAARTGSFTISAVIRVAHVEYIAAQLSATMVAATISATSTMAAVLVSGEHAAATLSATTAGATLTARVIEATPFFIRGGSFTVDAVIV